MRHICEQYRDYEKALSALREALKHMVKARAANKEERCKQLQQKIYLVDRFVEARKVTTMPALAPAVRVPLGSDRMCGFCVQVVKTDPNEMVKISHQLLEQPDVEAAVRRPPDSTLDSSHLEPCPRAVAPLCR